MVLVTKKNLKSFLFIVFVYCLIKIDSSALGNKKNPKKKSVVQLMYTKNTTGFNITENKKGCRWLKGVKHQFKLCMNRKGLPQLLKEIKNLTVMSCYKHFRYEQWPCLIKKKFFKKVYRETALMYSLSTSAFMFKVAKACAAGNLENCGCAGHGKSDNPKEWQWGGCGDNTKFAKSFTNKFFQIKKKGDKFQNILRYNSEMGINIVVRNEEVVCKCQGISGSCTYKICFKRLRPFENIAEELRNHYHIAVQVESENTIVDYRQFPADGKLLFLENSLNFCPDTVGRRCENADNCATLCCGRGFTTGIESKKKPCSCVWKNGSYEVSCQQCEEKETVYICK